MENKSNNWLERPVHPTLPAVTNEIVLFAGIIILALITRFYDLGTRVMSHDESLHTYFSWLLYRGQGYQHTPMMHGPFQFHALALSYFLFGVSDFTARIPAVLFSVATVWMVWPWRRYLGKWGVIVAGFLMVISPYMLYYGRYVRNETFAGFAGILLLYAVLRYLEKGESKYLYFITAASVLHFTSKETAFIYTAQILIFLGLLFIVRVTSQRWENKFNYYNVFIVLLTLALLLGGAGLGVGYINHQESTLSPTETAAPADPTTGLAPQAAPTDVSVSTILYVAAIVFLLAAVVILIMGYGWANILKERSFDIILLLMTFVLPMLVPLALEGLKSSLQVVIPTDVNSVRALDSRAMLIIGVFVSVFFAVSITAGLLWKREWWKYAALFWGTFVILYTTMFTNAPGFFTGLLGSLGYWIEQQAVERGSQPKYYYWLIQIPIYEFLIAIGSITATVLGLKKLFRQKPVIPEENEAENEVIVVENPSASDESNFGTFFWLLVFWVVTSILVFTIAGERMPWLTYHMAWPMVLLTGWGLGQIIEGTIEKIQGDNAPWWQPALSLLVAAVFTMASFNAIRALFGASPPFQGTELIQLEATSAFLFPLIVMILAALLLMYLMKEDLIGLGIVALFVFTIATFIASIINGASLLEFTADPALAVAEGKNLFATTIRFASPLFFFVVGIVGMNLLSRKQQKSTFVSLATLAAFGLLAVQTGRTAFRAAYIFYDDATEYLVYAHGATGIKDVMTQMDEISERTAGGLNAVVAYDASAPDTGVSWPFVWYLRDYTAARSFDAPTRSLREAVAVVVDQKNFDKINAALGNEYYEFDYIRMWWPNQDYFNLNQTRVLNAITDENIRQGIFDIWFDRDYTRYAQAINSSNMTLTNWVPADQMKLFVRKDVASQIWNYGVGPAESIITRDPYEDGITFLAADTVYGSDRYPPLGLNAPRAMATGLNDDFYIADSRNHRILHIASDGSLLHQWGTYADNFSGDAPIGTFNEPWGVAVGPDGSVYVTDTWNHRVQKFTEDGQAVTMWGQFGQPLPGDAQAANFFWGPRGIAVDDNGHVLVTDTGNKRIVVFDEDGTYITEFGTTGFDPGQFDEPVGLAIAPSGTVYVADTWNQRVQGFTPSEDGTFYTPSIQWDVNGWFGQSLDNKPFIAVGPNEHVFVTDPEGYRVIEFTADGEFVRTWGDFGSGPEEIGLASGITVDQLGFVWVTDSGNNRILRYRLP